MAGPAALHATTATQLRTIDSVTVFEGQVPSAPPADAGTGRVYPYVVLWGAPGFTPEEARNLEGDADGGLEWPVQVTVAAGDLTWCLGAVGLVRAALDGFRVPGGRLAEELGGPGVQVDEDTRPVRFYVPLFFRSLTA
jgi:hypothetical protein